MTQAGESAGLLVSFRKCALLLLMLLFSPRGTGPRFCMTADEDMIMRIARQAGRVKLTNAFIDPP
jgi:hypothetical protein